MQVTKPFTVNDSNMTSTVAEPDLTQGEVEWIEGRPSRFATEETTAYGAVNIDDVTYVYSDFGATRKVSSYDSGWVFISSFSVDGTPSQISSDGEFIYVAGVSNVDYSVIEVRKYNVTGSLISLVSVQLPRDVTTFAGGVPFCTDGTVIYIYAIGTGVTYIYTANAISGELINENSSTDVAVYSMYGITLSDTGFLLCDGVNLITSSTDLSNVGSKVEALIDGYRRFGAYLSKGKVYSGLLSLTSITSAYAGFSAVNGESTGVYVTGEQVIKTSTHKIYQAVTDTTDDPEIGVNLTPASWVEVSATNKYRAFDFVTNLQTVGASPLVMTLTPDSIFSTLAVFNVTGATSVNVTVTDPIDGEVYNQDIEMIDITGVINLWQYLFYEHVYISQFLLDDLPQYKYATITVTFTGPGDIGVGEMAYGKAKTIGRMTTGSTLDRKSYTKLEIDDFGNITTGEKVPTAAYVDFKVDLSTALASYVDSTLKDVDAIPALFSGNSVDDQVITALGYCERSPITLKHTRSSTSIKVRNIV